MYLNLLLIKCSDMFNSETIDRRNESDIRDKKCFGDELDIVIKTKSLKEKIIFCVFIPCKIMRSSDDSENPVPQISKLKV